MLRSRISRRVLAEQHLALTNQFNDLHDHGPAAKQGRHIGIIDTSLSPAESIKALEPLLPKVTGVKTEIIIEGNTDVRLAFIQEHIQYIVFELLKNSVLAALKTGRPDAAGKVYVTIADNPMSVGIRVSDEGERGAPASACALSRVCPLTLITVSLSPLQLEESHPSSGL